eukprot:UN26642
MMVLSGIDFPVFTTLSDESVKCRKLHNQQCFLFSGQPLFSERYKSHLQDIPVNELIEGQGWVSGLQPCYPGSFD